MKIFIYFVFISIGLIANECHTVEQFKNTSTPLDIYKDFIECVNEERYDDGAKLFFIANAYGYYDTQRVSDRTAHQAISVLRMSVGSALNEKQRAEFQASAKSIAGSDRTEICKILKTVGKPNYHPSYMINHGLKAFEGPQENGGLNTYFNPDSAWNDTLTNYFKCSEK